MGDRDEILSFCNELLEVDGFEDYGPNGLQVPGAERVSKVATAVSANLATLEAAVGVGAELILCHHGLFWSSQQRALSAPMAARLRTVLSAQASVAGYHLPLDAHREIGNNALLRGRLRLARDDRPFAVARGRPIGAIGQTAEPLSLAELSMRLREVAGREPLVFDSGPEEVRSVGIMTGGGAFAIHDAGRLGLDALVTGEPSEPVMGEAREYGVHFLAGGHYATETLGIRRLGELIAERFEIEHEFVDVPNPV